MNERIAYCTNVHAGADLAATEANLVRHAARVRALVVPDGALGIGLWLSARALADIASADDARRLRDRLGAIGLAVVTLNGFPYGDFHGPRVKHAVYQPEWGRPERLAYTRRLAEVLVDLVPRGTTRASISTLPIGWRARPDAGTGMAEAASNLRALASDLSRLEDASGVRVTVDLEPEPGCALDRASDVVELFERHFQTDTDRRHLGVCHDICHAAVMFEDQAEALDRYRRAGIGVHKVQVSSALEADGSPESLAALAAFDEPRYLHQTCVRSGTNVTFFEDLPDALSARPAGIWRTHFHVPIHLATLYSLRPTQREIRECLESLDEATPTLEAETYAWGVLPRPMQPGSLADGIAAELRWLDGVVG